jgi:hypothetical protein
MRIAYFDCFAGISGDMTLGALLDAGADISKFREELEKLSGIEFELEISKVVKHGINATHVDVHIAEEHHHRRLKDITNIIETSDLCESVKTRAIGIFRNLAEAEARVHGTTPDQIHFHEVGAVDAIVDIVGTSIGIELLGIEKIIASPLPMGHGFVKAAHGTIPLPAPATVELLKGAPVYNADIEGELVTPTGAAIIRTLASEFGSMPDMTINTAGYGAGTYDFGIPNVLRVMIGKTEDTTPRTRKVAIVETNIDDMNPEIYDSVFEKLFKAGALDVYLTPIHMKKNRPATLLTAICPVEASDPISRTILTETTSFGVRISVAERRCLDRRWEKVATKYGEIRVKIGALEGNPTTASPEYEDCRRAAEACDVPIRKVYEEASAAYKAKV